ncbi:MAG: GNAT family N-acetyltransferase, partial [Alphaproteobacteria bacterium]|nr:GNAT family N-acetyltransferase [Alphaproteobacteria bacterium]
ATRRYARNRRPPSESEHHHWITDRLSDPGCLLNLVLRDCEPAGVLRLDALTEDPLAYEVSILTAPEYHRRGIGGAALALARALVPGARLKAVVLPGNRASQALFTAAGYLGGADDAWWSEPTPATPGAPERSREHARERSHA